MRLLGRLLRRLAAALVMAACAYGIGHAHGYLAGYEDASWTGGRDVDPPPDKAEPSEPSAPGS